MKLVRSIFVALAVAPPDLLDDCQAADAPAGDSADGAKKEKKAKKGKKADKARQGRRQGRQVTLPSPGEASASPEQVNDPGRSRGRGFFSSRAPSSPLTRPS